MKLYGDPLTPQESRDADSGLRPSFQALLGLLDTSDPAWPTTAAALREMADAGVEIDAIAVQIATKLGAHRLQNTSAAPLPSWPRMQDGSIVYYIRRGPVIKIGTTAYAPGRFEDLLPDEILAFEPGDVKVETRRHRQFAHLRRRGEHFLPEPELLEHIRLIREKHGDPDPEWPTINILLEPLQRASHRPRGSAPQILCTIGNG